MSDTGKRMKEQRKRMGISADDLANYLGVSRSTIFRYENGYIEKIPANFLTDIAKFLKTTEAYLMGWKDEESMPSIKPIPINIHPIESQKIPLLGEIACGIPKYTNEDRESYVMAGTDIKADFCLKASGDSMVGARILDGDIVFIRKQEMVDNGEIAAVVVNNDSEATLKRLFYYKEKALLILKAENPAYEDLIFQNEELNEVHILGKAVAFQSDVR